MTKFRPCIDLHEGKVKQIVGGSLRDGGDGPQENFVAEQGAGWFAERFREDRVGGGHVIMLGPGNETAAREALAAWPGGLQVGGGITPASAEDWLQAGASHVIVTSWLFDGEGRLRDDRLAAMTAAVGAERLVIDLSCRRAGDGWRVAMNRWQTLTDLEVGPGLLERLADSCAEFLVHAADVEGKCGGVDRELVELLGGWDGGAVTYAGGARGIGDLRLVEEASRGRLDVTIGSALDLFGGSGVRYSELLEWNAGRLR
ncbi:MAG: phosphoribosylformimino-5-aminoimidazole carboxamide ribotide isomerase [Akkermansiaceae bacterium]|nr:phosphoribosylformimino-5-aminoimidazole carboxamide ribotide isomerase [Akkermansiaceae bacterium]